MERTRTAPELDAVTPYGSGAGSSRVRVLDWLARVKEPSRAHTYAGLSSASPPALLRHPGHVLAAERDLRALVGSRTGRLLLHREASPLSRGGLEVRLLRSAGLSVYDFDDALHCDLGEGPLYRRYAPKARKAELAVCAADRVIAGNAVLADWAAQHNGDVVVIPSCVDLGDYEAKVDFTVSDPPRLGWIGSWSTEVHLTSIADALLTLHDKVGARLAIIGEVHPGLGDLERMIDRTAWSVEAQRRGLRQFDVGLMPLMDTPYSRGKCGYKLLQYLAAGLPAVASPVGVNEEILARAGLPGARSTDEWIGAISTLIDVSTEHREHLGRRARETAQAHYSFEAWRDTWRHATGLTS